MYSIVLGHVAASVGNLIRTFRVNVVPSSSGAISKTDLPLKIKYCVRKKKSMGMRLSIDVAVYPRITEFLATPAVLLDQRGEIDI
jgi:hypothetical protein